MVNDVSDVPGEGIGLSIMLISEISGRYSNLIMVLKERLDLEQ